MHRRRKRSLFTDERSCAVCHRTESTLLTMFGTHIKHPLKTNAVDDEKRCGHDFCEQCLQRLFDESPKKVFDCPSCGAVVKLKQLKAETIAQIDAVREREKRARVNKIRNRTKESFKSSSEYENFLTESEELVWKLVNFIDVKKTEIELEHYEKSHKSEIEQCESNRLAVRREERRKINELIETRKLLKIEHDKEDFGIMEAEDDDDDEHHQKKTLQQHGAITLIQPKPKLTSKLKENISEYTLNSSSWLKHAKCCQLMRAGGFNFEESFVHSKHRFMTELRFHLS